MEAVHWTEKDIESFRKHFQTILEPPAPKPVKEAIREMEIMTEAMNRMAQETPCHVAMEISRRFSELHDGNSTD